MRLAFTPNGWSDFTHWLAADRQTLRRINRLVYLVDGDDPVILKARFHDE